MGRLDGRVAIVTGAGRGIGVHYARALAREGARVMVADVIDPKDVVAELSGAHGADAVAGAVVDVSDEAATRQLAADTVKRFGRIDILVNNAAVYASLKEKPFTEIPVAEWDKVMAVNVRGLFLMAKAVAPTMTAQNYGKIINIGSGSAQRGMAGLLHYVTSKGAVIGFTRALCRELGDAGVCVNTLAPGFTLSDSVQEHNPQHVEGARAPAIARRALKRDAWPEDLLGTLVFLCSADSDFMTGQTLAVDGGATNT